MKLCSFDECIFVGCFNVYTKVLFNVSIYLDFKNINHLQQHYNETFNNNNTKQYFNALEIYSINTININ